MDMSNADKWVSAHKAATLLRAGAPMINRLVAQGVLTERRTPSGRRFLLRDEIDTILANGTRKAIRPPISGQARA